MAIKLLNLGRTSQPPDDLDPHVDPDKQDTLRIIFHHSGTFCSPDSKNFDPHLPDGVFFTKDQTWPPNNGVAKPNRKGPTRYWFHKSSKQVRGVEDIGSVADIGSPTVSGDTVSGDHVIHIP